MTVIKLSKIFSREHTLFYVYMWNRSDRLGFKQWLNHDLKNSLFLKKDKHNKISVWYEEKEFNQIRKKIAQRFKKDKSLLDKLAEILHEEEKTIASIFDHKKEITNIRELEKYYKSITNWWSSMVILFEVPDLKDIPKIIRQRALHLRRLSEKYSDKQDIVFINFWRSKYPKMRDITFLIKPSEIFSMKNNNINKRTLERIKERINGYGLFNSRLYLLPGLKKKLENSFVVLDKKTPKALDKKEKWINHISRDMSLMAIYYPFYVQVKKNIFDFGCKNSLYFSKKGFIKGYKSYKDQENTFKEIREYITKGELKKILKEFKRIIEKRIKLSNKFVNTDLEKKGLSWVIKEFENFHKFFLKYWSYHIFAFNLGNAVENADYEVVLKKHKDLINKIRRFHPFLFFDEKYLPHLFKYLEKESKIPQRKFYNLTPTEIITILKRKKIINLEEIKEREKYYLLKWHKDREKIYSGKEALKEYQRIIGSEDKEKIKEIKGKVVFMGKIKGRVKLVILKNDLKKVMKGDILVAPMTTPDYVPALRRVAAIVTDEGGIICHAAIISRELKIPCVIGTKNATKVLKDGDLVEVDANKGIVKKLK